MMNFQISNQSNKLETNKLTKDVTECKKIKTHNNNLSTVMIDTILVERERECSDNQLYTVTVWVPPYKSGVYGVWLL